MHWVRPPSACSTAVLVGPLASSTRWRAPRFLPRRGSCLGDTTSADTEQAERGALDAHIATASAVEHFIVLSRPSGPAAEIVSGCIWCALRRNDDKGLTSIPRVPWSEYHAELAVLEMRGASRSISSNNTRAAPPPFGPWSSTPGPWPTSPKNLAPRTLVVVIALADAVDVTVVGPAI